MKPYNTVRTTLNVARGFLSRSTLRVPRGPGKRVYLDVRQSIRHRTLRQLLLFFQCAGYEVLLRGRTHRLTWQICGDLRQHRGVKLLWRRPARFDSYLVCSDDAQLLQSLPAPRKLLLRFDYRPGLTCPPGEAVMPFTMHPRIYLEPSGNENLAAARNRRRGMRILFSGNFKQSAYDNPVTGELFGKLSRHQLVKFLQAKWPKPPEPSFDISGS